MSFPRFTLRTLLVAVALCAVAVLIYSWLPDTVTTAELHRVQLGMTREEVRKLLGEPANVLHMQPSPPDNLDEAWYYFRGYGWLDAPPAVGFREGRVAYVQ